MNLWIVVEEEYGEIYVHPFDSLQMARDYAKNECTGTVLRIELHVMNVGYQGKEQLEAS